MTHTGIDGVDVVLFTQDSSYEVTTGATGEFRVSGVKPGEYTASFGKVGFSVPREGLFPRLPPPVHVNDGDQLARIDIEMSPGATLSGRVLDSDGNPAAGIEVQTNLAGTVSTDRNGKFVFENLEPGSYTLLAKPSQAEAEGIVPLPTYFPSAADPMQAEPIPVSAGATLAGFEIHLRSAPVYKVRGKVLDRSGKPAARATVTLTGIGSATGCTKFGIYSGDGRAQIVIGGDCYIPLGAESRTDDEGAFEFKDVRAGEWAIRADYEGAWDDVRNMPIVQLGSGRVTVGHGGIEDLQIRVAALVPLQATADWGDTPAGGVPRKGGLMLISQEAARFGGQGIVTDPDQPPALVPAGRTLIAPGQPVDGYVLTSVLFGGRDVLGKVIDIEAAGPPLQLVYKRAVNIISGTVDKGPDATVLIFQTPPEGDIIVNAYPCHPIGPNGVFEITGMAAGDYYAAAVSHLRSGPPVTIDAEGIQRLTQSAQRVHMDAGTSLQLQLAVTPPE